MEAFKMETEESQEQTQEKLSPEELKKHNEEVEIISLLSSLVKSHYLEKSEIFQKAADFEKLFKLDHLERLKYLEELKALSGLDHLQELQELKKLSHLSELEQLDKLEILTKLEKLDQLSHLEQLENLHSLNQLHQLKGLSRLSELKQLRSLENLQEMDKLHQLDRLSELKSLSELNSLSELKKLDNLERLNNLEQLENLKNLRELERLQIINTLTRALDEHKTVLAPLVHLDQLEELAKLKDLHKLSDLDNLDKLDELQRLDKLDRLEETRFADRLDKLDKLDILQKGTTKLVIQQFIGFGLELLKLTAAGFVIVYFLTTQTGRDVTAKALPAIGFSSGAQVSLGLKLLVGETSAEEFQGIINDVQKRMEAEIEAIFSASGLFSIERRIELVNQVQSYSYQGHGVDLTVEAKTKLQEKLLKITEYAISRLEFDMALARGRQDDKTSSLLREIKLLLSQKQYPQLLEKSLPLWGHSEALNMASVAGAISLKLQDPATLEELLRTIPRKGAQ